MNSRVVIYARLQTEAYVPGAGSLGTVFPPQGKTLENLTMTTQLEGLIIAYTYRGIRDELLIPYANVALMKLAPEDTKKPSVKVAA